MLALVIGAQLAGSFKDKIPISLRRDADSRSATDFLDHATSRCRIPCSALRLISLPLR